jgi:endo-1,4-beta-xylanase
VYERIFNLINTIMGFFASKQSSIICLTLLNLVTFFGTCEKPKPLQLPSSLKSGPPFPVGAAVNPTLIKTNASYARIIAKEFNSLTAENAMKFTKTEPGQNFFDFAEGDYLVKFAQLHHQRVHGHTLIWYNALPNWVLNFKGDSSAWEHIFKNHIITMVSHYKGKVTAWDVVNEAISNRDGTLVNQSSNTGEGSVWRQHLGPDYVARAFRYAHEADPAALLFYNDYGNGYGQAWDDRKLNAMINLVANLKKRKIFVSGFGIQMHINIYTDEDNIVAMLKKVAATGLLIHISELDIAVNPGNYPDQDYTGHLQDLQAEKYKFIAQTYKKVVPHAQQYGITTWEFRDNDSWVPVFFKRPDWPLLFDKDYKKKVAYTGYLQGLSI